MRQTQVLTGDASEQEMCIAGVTSSSMKSREFMKRYATLADTATASGYNPLLQDFSNTSFFVGQTC
jgi:hypothetical protein